MQSSYEGGFDEVTSDGRIRHKSITPMHQNAGTGTWVRRGSSWEDAHSEENTKREDLVSKPDREFVRHFHPHKVTSSEYHFVDEGSAAEAAAKPPEPTTASDLARALAGLRVEEEAAPAAAEEDVLWA